MSKFQEEEFIKLGKHLYERELLNKKYQDNFKLLKNRFNHNVEIYISKEEFQKDNIDTIVWNLQETYDFDGSEISTLMYPRILEHKLAEQEKEIEIHKNAYTDLEAINHSNLEEIEVFEKRIRRGRNIISSKNEIIQGLEKQLERKILEINTWFSLCILILFNLLLSCIDNKNYLGFWYFIFSIFSGMVIGFFSIIYNLF